MSFPTCNYCKMEFDNKSNVNKHQKTSIYCIKIQNEQDPSKKIEMVLHECEFCKRQLSTKYALQKHLIRCKIKNKKMKNEESELILVKKEVKLLQQQLTNFKETTTTNLPKKERKKENIPKSVKTHVWNLYIGSHINEHRCLCCKKTYVKNTDFHCGHVVSENDGGTREISNLRPICAPCNHSMGSLNMIDFVKMYGYYIG